MQEFRWIQAGGIAVFGDVAADREKLLGAADEMIKGLLLPKSPVAPEPAIDRPGSEFLPGIADGLDLSVTKQTHQRMDVLCEAPNYVKSQSVLRR